MTLETQNTELTKNSWDKIAPFWPLQNLIACNPLQGFENLEFKKALEKANHYFYNSKLPKELDEINRQTIKWSQVFFDNGQSTIKMPNREKGFYESVKSLIVFDNQIHKNNSDNVKLIESLPKNSNEAINKLLSLLSIEEKDHEEFLTLILTTLNGWSSYVRYLGQWSDENETNKKIQEDYLAIRLLITFLIWPEAKIILNLKEDSKNNFDAEKLVSEIEKREQEYSNSLIEKLQSNSPEISQEVSEAQLVFCIDVRSEGFRRAIEAQGNYETLGFAGFFGVPIEVKNKLTEESHASCPVLLKPQHKIVENPCCSGKEIAKQVRGLKHLKSFKKFYQSLKYNFATPLVLAEGIGLWSGIWMTIRSFLPISSNKITKDLYENLIVKPDVTPDISSISFEQQTAYASGALNMMGLTSDFAKIIALCGHGSSTQNNAFATSLDCGACGGRHGGSNAKVLAQILNNKEVRKALLEQEIKIPQTTVFIAAQHDTTTDEVEIYKDNNVKIEDLAKLSQDLQQARKLNSLWRAREMGYNGSEKQSEKFTYKKSNNWAETRPEWGLARNAAFVIGPRDVTRNLNLESRSFLHSYDWSQDPEGNSLTVILTAPMIVTQWINTQYLFSTLNNVAFGSGNKITQNVTGKIGVMQGNASDLMHGLPLQSVYKNDKEQYHQAQRLNVVVVAPRAMIDRIVAKHEILQKLFGNGWVILHAMEPEDGNIYNLNQKLNWQKAHS